MERTPTKMEELLNHKTVVYSKRRYWIGRRAQDIFFSALGLILLWPLLLAVAVAICCADPHGCPFTAQTRVGRKGVPFTLYRFRCVYGEEDRLTPVGEFLSEFGLDGLPQLWNILRGDMSIVGPRPARPREAEGYSEYQSQRLYVTPGVISYWQVQPDGRALSADERIELDIRYMKERSFLMDWKLILKAADALLEGTYHHLGKHETK